MRTHMCLGVADVALLDLVPVRGDDWWRRRWEQWHLCSGRAHLRCHRPGVCWPKIWPLWLIVTWHKPEGLSWSITIWDHWSCRSETWQLLPREIRILVGVVSHTIVLNTRSLTVPGSCRIEKTCPFQVFSLSHLPLPFWRPHSLRLRLCPLFVWPRLQRPSNRPD